MPRLRCRLGVEVRATRRSRPGSEDNEFSLENTDFSVVYEALFGGQFKKPRPGQQKRSELRNLDLRSSKFY